MVSYKGSASRYESERMVLILVVVEDGLVLLAMLAPGAADIES